MSLASKLLASSGGTEPLYSDSVFSAYTYTGNGSTQTITNGIDLAGKGGLVWIKPRTAAASQSHRLWDTTRAAALFLSTDNTNGNENVGGTPITPTSTGYNTNSEIVINQNTHSYISWTFRKAPKFFDVVTYAGNGVAGRQIPHALGIAPGMVIVKKTSATSNWPVYHSGTGLTFACILNGTESSGTSTRSPVAAVDSTSITLNRFATDVSGDTNPNASGVTYVAYLFAHDTSADGIVQCGSFTTDGGGNATVNLGWEPQYLMAKGSSTTGNWILLDSARDLSMGNDGYLQANASAAEITSLNIANPTATGFVVPAGVLTASQTFVYLAIRRPNKPPTLGTQVYNAIARTGTGAAATVTGVGFAPDLVIAQLRDSNVSVGVVDRLRGRSAYLATQSTAAEASSATATNDLTSFNMDGVSVGVGSTSNINFNTHPIINYFFKRAPGVFDEVCYTGTGAAESHNLGVIPEMVIYKARGTASDWGVDFANHTGYLNQTAALTATPVLSDPTRASTTIFRPYSAYGTTMVAYLFATKAGISKVFSFTGNGTSQIIDCGFTTGARFVLIKRTDSTGDWYVWDSVRGIVSGNDPHLSLNTTAAEVTTDDSIDPNVLGFVCNQVAATNINVNAATYIGLAFA